VSECKTQQLIPQSLALLIIQVREISIVCACGIDKLRILPGILEQQSVHSASSESLVFFEK
jgi:hypothetical protein